MKANTTTEPIEKTTDHDDFDDPDGLADVRVDITAPGRRALTASRPSRSATIGLMRTAGFHADRAELVRIQRENPVAFSEAIARAAFAVGTMARINGGRCGCPVCARKTGGRHG